MARTKQNARKSTGGKAPRKRKLDGGGGKPPRKKSDKKQKTRYQCPQCQQIFPKWTRCLNHLESEHPEFYRLHVKSGGEKSSATRDPRIAQRFRLEKVKEESTACLVVEVLQHWDEEQEVKEEVTEARAGDASGDVGPPSISPALFSVAMGDEPVPEGDEPVPEGDEPALFSDARVPEGEPDHETAREVLEADAPELARMLTDAGLLNDAKLLRGSADPTPEFLTALSELASELKKAQQPAQSSSSGSQSTGQYAIKSLNVLVALARQQAHTGAVWGYHRQLKSFVFSFPAQRRVVLEKSQYGLATYVFEHPACLDDFLGQLWLVLKLCGREAVVTNTNTLSKFELSDANKITLVEAGVLPAEDNGLGCILGFVRKCIHTHRKGVFQEASYTKCVKDALLEGLYGGTPEQLQPKVQQI